MIVTAIQANNSNTDQNIDIATRDTLGVVRVGNSLDIDLNGILDVKPVLLTKVPIANDNTVGGIKTGQNIHVTSEGVAWVPPATATKLGTVRSGGDIDVDTDGKVTVNPRPATMDGNLGAITVTADHGLTLNNSGDIRVIPATYGTIGGVIVDNNTLNIDEYGVLKINKVPVEIPVASETQLGGIKVGKSLTINNEILNVKYIEAVRRPDMEYDIGDTVSAAPYFPDYVMVCIIAGTTSPFELTEKEMEEAVLDGYLLDGTVKWLVTKLHHIYVHTYGDEVVYGTKTFLKDIVGNISSADKLKTKRNIKISGDASGNVDFDGSTDVDIVTNIEEVTTTRKGFMSPQDKVKLDGIEEEANKYILPTAKEDRLGGVKLSDSIIAADAIDSGKIKVADNSHKHIIDNITNLQTALDNKLETSLKGSSNGLAELDSNKLVPLEQLPSAVFNNVEGYLYNGVFYEDIAHTIVITPETGKIYIDLHKSNIYIWNGSEYVEISIILGETSTTAYRGDRGKIAYDHSQVTDDNPHATKFIDILENIASSTNLGGIKVGTDLSVTSDGVLSGDYKVVTTTTDGLMSSYDKVKMDILDPTSDMDKPVSTAQQIALDKKMDRIIYDPTGGDTHYQKIAEASLIDMGSQVLNCIVSSPDNFGATYQGVYLITFSTRGCSSTSGIPAKVVSLLSTEGTSAKFAYKWNSTTSKMELWIQRPGYSNQTNLDILSRHNVECSGFYDSSTTTEPAGLIYLEQENVGGGDKNLVSFCASDSIPSGYLLCNGAAVSRTAYSALFAKIGTKYGGGDGWSTFNLPNLMDRFIQGSSTAGTVKNAGLPNITGSFRVEVLCEGARYADGAFYDTGDPGYGADGERYNEGPLYGFNASRCSSIYGNSSTVQPPALTMLPVIKY